MVDFSKSFNYIIYFWLCVIPANMTMSSTTPYAKRLQSITYIRFRLLRFRSPLLSQSLDYFLFVLLLRCFSSQAFLHTDYWFIWGYKGITPCGFPHSEICGSRLFVSSPQHIADLHVLHRLLIPRHSPLALCSFTLNCILNRNSIYKWYYIDDYVYFFVCFR